MKILIVFFSGGGRTRQVAQTIAAELHNAEVVIEQLKYSGSARNLVMEQEVVMKGDLSKFTFNRDVLDLAPYDRVFFGTPTYGGRAAPAFYGFLENCKNVAGKEWVIFATCRLSGGQNLNLMRAAIEQKGGKVIAQQMFKAFFKINLQRAQVFGQSLNK
jgi:flavodoxin